MNDLNHNKSQNAILKTAKELFWNRGINQVSVEDICKKANVSKMTFYRHYENKMMVACIVTEMFLKDVAEQYDNIISRDVPFEQKVKEIIQLEHKGAKDISKEFLKDINYENSEIKQLFDEYGQKMMGKILEYFKEAQSNGQIRKEIKMSFIMYMLNIMKSVLNDKQLVDMYNDVPQLSKELSIFFFYGILPHKDNQ